MLRPLYHHLHQTKQHLFLVFDWATMASTSGRNECSALCGEVHLPWGAASSD